MRKIVIVSMLPFFAMAACKHSSRSDSGKINSQLVQIDADGKVNGPRIMFTDTLHSFGTITEGERVTCVYPFKNTGTSDLLITDAHASCGCTKPTYPHDPIAANGTGKIEVTFDSDGKSGNYTKNITITSNTMPPTTVLKFTVNVQPKSTN